MGIGDTATIHDEKEGGYHDANQCQCRQERYQNEALNLDDLGPLDNIQKMGGHDQVVTEQDVLAVLASLHLVYHQVRDSADVIPYAGGVALGEDVPNCVEEVATNWVIKELAT